MEHKKRLQHPFSFTHLTWLPLLPPNDMRETKNYAKEGTHIMEDEEEEEEEKFHYSKLTLNNEELKTTKTQRKL